MRVCVCVSLLAVCVFYTVLFSYNGSIYYVRLCKSNRLTIYLQKEHCF